MATLADYISSIEERLELHREALKRLEDGLSVVPRSTGEDKVPGWIASEKATIATYERILAEAKARAAKD